ncbi:hypothetical protein AB0I98_47245 [Streptomyces sp. NPDC050211]|uniref:hypothetical protein n=1 Tax=Streptomyces sp. NPDC050211 TaxID=3154932 RepID=UPI003413A652
MSEDDTRLRQKAAKLTRKAEASWAAYEAAGFTRRADATSYLRATARAETALFRVVRAAPDDPAPRFKYGEITNLHSWVFAVHTTGRLMAAGSVQLARGALWAFDRPELNDLDPSRIAQLVEEPSVETEFTSVGGGSGLVRGESRVAAAADVRVTLADRLARFRPRPPGDALTPEALDAYFRADNKVHMGDEAMVWRCQLTSCRGRDAAGEARILLTEAAQIYRVLEAVGNRFGPDDAEQAEQRREAVLKKLPLDLR